MEAMDFFILLPMKQSNKRSFYEHQKNIISEFGDYCR
jgi:hypothetical protein